MSDIGYVYSTDEPIYAAGAERQHDGSYRVWGFGTSRLPEIGILLTRHLRRDIMFPLFDQGATRLISTGLGGHPNIARWIKALGASVACTTDLSGKDVAMYIWERP